jgi:hypothetical protein
MLTAEDNKKRILQLLSTHSKGFCKKIGNG